MAVVAESGLNGGLVLCRDPVSPAVGVGIIGREDGRAWSVLVPASLNYAQV